MKPVPIPIPKPAYESPLDEFNELKKSAEAKLARLKTYQEQLVREIQFKESQLADTKAAIRGIKDLLAPVEAPLPERSGQ